jgi:hypothetical protein
VASFALGSQGEVGYLQNNGQHWLFGCANPIANRVVSFAFDSAGSIVYLGLNGIVSLFSPSVTTTQRLENSMPSSLFKMDGAGDAVALGQDGNLIRFTPESTTAIFPWRGRHPLKKGCLLDGTPTGAECFRARHGRNRSGTARSRRVSDFEASLLSPHCREVCVMLAHHVGFKKPLESPVVDTGEDSPKPQKDSASYQAPQLHEIGTLEQVQGFGDGKKDFVTYRP